MNKKFFIIIISIKYFLLCSKAKIKKNKYIFYRKNLNNLFFLKSSVREFLSINKFLLKRKSISKINVKRKKNDENVGKIKNYETFLIVDGSSILYKNFFGMPILKNDNEINLSTIYGFIQSLNKIYNLFSPSYVVIVFDSKTSNDNKKKIYSKYKIYRKKNPEEIYEQLKIVSDFCDLIGIKTISSTNVESDNYIASIVDNIYNTIKNKTLNIYKNDDEDNRIINENSNDIEKIKEEDEITKANEDKKKNDYENELRVVVVSSDKDLLQLLEYNYNNNLNNMKIYICQPNKKYRLVDSNLFYEEYNIMPHQYCDYLILSGDKTDGISGVPNIGDKTSKYLLKEFYNIDNILKNLHKLPNKLHNILLNNIENINIFRKLIKLKCETNQSLVLNDYKQKNIKNFEKFQNFVDKYSLHKLLRKSIIINYK
ncbi:5'-3' exonuclease, N-terminal resolvase-like domain, putative [Plasmodium gallinaceum]|uniref:5'-3' exonuclease, N-terminal resolvase-like domain, putative n=1 Tax=Plasmodium gallinaceum TaxID=5849 RepID=A0A1J1GSE3_PLAGA|nr:5'-3' exonuclease, N-terminal resolvase-like domain, putative [Plasmodium gallinaceum]CRG95435.1 5'-3' exonuclease, N-terminal resolvase-like domain, putative [Plasmodium gallinaceum]